MAELITSLTFIFVAAAFMLLFSEILSQPAIPAYITGGVLIGFYINQSELLGLAQIGIAFLVFIFGLKFDPEKLTAVRDQAIAVNTLQVVLLGTVSFAFGLIIGLDTLQAVYFSIAATLSSSLVGLELISEEVDKNLIHGRLSESINLIQDLVAVAAIIALSSLGAGFEGALQNLGVAVSMIAGALFIRKYLFDYIGRLADGSSELLMLTGLTFLTGFIAVSQITGLSIAIGAFAAGIAVARFPHNLEILDTMGSIKDFFAAIFFVTLGALLSVPSIEVLTMAAGIVVLTSLVNPATVMLSLIHQGYDSRTSFMTGVSLDQVSEFALIIAIQAWISGMIVEPLFQAIVLAATITMTTSAYTRIYQHRIFEALNRYSIIDSEDRILPETNAEKIENHIVLVGYDTQGKRIVEQIKEIGADFVVIENDPEKISDLKEKGENYVYGNVLNEDTWREVNYEDAKLIVSTAPFPRVSDRILELETDAGIILRTGELQDAEELMELGADYVIVPEILTAELVKEHIMGMNSEENYVEELRRRSLLEVRRYLESEEG